MKEPFELALPPALLSSLEHHPGQNRLEFYLLLSYCINILAIFLPMKTSIYYLQLIIRQYPVSFSYLLSAIWQKLICFDKNKFQISQAGFIRFTKKTLATYLIAFMVFSGTGLLFLFNPFGTKQADAAWFNDSWGYRKALTIDGSKVSGSSNLVDFPVLVSLTTDTELAANAQDDGDDIVFTLQSGERLFHEIEKFDGATGQLIAWVRIPSLAPTVNTTIYMYYGNLTTISQQRAADVWDSNYQLVQHMEETSAVSTTLTDSTRFANNGTKETANVPAPSTGKIGGGQSKTTGGTASDLQIASSMTYPSGTADYTMDFWIKPNTAGNYTFMMWGIDGSSHPTFQLLTLTTGAVRLAYNSSTIMTTAGGTLTNGTYAHVVLTRSGNTHTFYINGTQSGSTTSSSVSLNFSTSCPLHLMAGISGTDCVNNANQTHRADLDEFRYSLTSRSADYIATEYNNENSPSTFLSAGSEEKGTTPDLYLKLDDAQGITAQDSTASNNDGTLMGTPSWKTEDLCLLGKCVYLDGESYSENTTPATVQSISTNAYGGTNTHTAGTLGSAITSGNLLIWIVRLGDGSSGRTVSWPSGYTQVAYNSDAEDNDEVYIATKIAGASEDRDPTMTWTGGDSFSQRSTLIEVSGADTTTPMDVTPTVTWESFTSSYTTGGLTTTIDNALHIIGYENRFGTGSTTPPSGYTERVDTNDMWVADKTIPTAGATGTYTITVSSGYIWSFEIAVRPAVASSTSNVSIDNTVSGIKTVSFWVKPNSFSSTTPLVDLNGTAKITTNSSGTISTSGITSPTIYVNGVVSSTLTSGVWQYVTVTTGTGINGSAIRIGTDGTNGLIGFVDEVKIYSNAISASQVAANYTARGNEGISSVLGANTQNKPGTLSNGLVGYWKTDESSGNAADSSGNGLTLTNNNTVAYAGGKFGNAASFTAASSRYLSTASTISGVKTVSFWTYNASDTDEYINLTTSAYITSSSGTVSATGFTSPTIYVNGTANGTLAASSWNQVVVTTNTAINADQFEIGRGNSAYNNGKIDGIRVYNRALSPADVSQLYNWAPGPVGYWKMDEGTGTSLFDSSGYGNNSTTWTAGSPAIAWGNGIYGKDLLFNNSNHNSTVRIAESTSLDLGKSTDSFTISAWVKPSATQPSGGGYVVAKFTAASNLAFVLALVGTDQIQFEISGGSDYIAAYQAPSSLVDNKWHHIVGVRDITNLKMYLYLDGVLMPSATTTITAQNASNNDDISIGNGSTGGSGDYLQQDFRGEIDDVKIYNYARNAGQIVEDMNGGHPAPGSPVGTPVAYWKLDEGYSSTAHDSNSSTGGAEDLSLSNTASWTNSSKFGKGWNGDGSRWLSRADDNDLDFAASDNFTISLWFKSNSTTNPASLTAEYLVSKVRSSSTPEPGYTIMTDSFALGLVCLVIDDDTTFDADDAACSTTDLYDTNWHYLTATKTGTSRIDFYVDGVLNGSDTSISATGTLANSRTFYLGDQDGVDNGSELNGTLDEVKVFRSALTADQIKLDYNHGAAQQLGTISSGSSNTDSNNASTQEYCVPGDNTTCTAPFGRWDFEQKTGTTVYDTSGNAYDATFTGSALPTWTIGKVGNGVNFSGAGSGGTATRLTVNSSASVKNLTTYTVEAWVNLSSLSGTETVYGESTANSGAARLQLFADPAAAKCTGGKFGVSFRSSDSDSIQNLCATTAPVANRWYYMTFVFNSTTDVHRIYINGIQEATSTFAASTVSNTAPTNGISIGAFPSGSALLNGTVDQVRIFNYERTPAQIAWDYNRGGPVAWYKMDECQGTTINDSSGNSYTGTLTVAGSGTYTSAGTCATSSASSTWYNGVSGKRNFSVAVDTDDYITTSAFSPLSAAGNTTATLSWGGWFYPVSSAASKTLLEKASGFQLTTDASSYPICGVYYSAAFHNSSAPSTALSLNTWNHIMCTYDGANINTYLNGALIKQSAETNSLTAASSILYMARTSGGANFFSGKLDDIRIYNYTLTSNQVKAIYTNGALRFGPDTGSP